MDRNFHRHSGRPSSAWIAPLNYEGGGSYSTSAARRSGSLNTSIPTILVNAAPPQPTADNDRNYPPLPYPPSDDGSSAEHDYNNASPSWDDPPPAITTLDRLSLDEQPPLNGVYLGQRDYPSIHTVLQDQGGQGIAHHDLQNNNSQYPTYGLPIWPGNNLSFVQHVQSIPITTEGHVEDVPVTVYRQRGIGGRDHDQGSVQALPASENSTGQGALQMLSPSLSYCNRAPVEATYQFSNKPGHDPPQDEAWRDFHNGQSADYGGLNPPTPMRAHPYMSGPFYDNQSQVASNYLSLTHYYQEYLFNGSSQYNPNLIFERNAQASRIPIQSQGIPEHVPVGSSVTQRAFNIDTLFLECLLVYVVGRQTAGTLQPGSVEIDEIREDVKMAVVQKIPASERVADCKLAIDNMFSRSKQKVGTAAIRNDRDKQKYHEQTHWCPFRGCGGAFTRSNGLKNHLAAHFDVKDIRCGKCNKWLRGPSSTRHINNCKG